MLGWKWEMPQYYYFRLTAFVKLSRKVSLPENSCRVRILPPNLSPLHNLMGGSTIRRTELEVWPSAEQLPFDQRRLNANLSRGDLPASTDKSVSRNRCP